MPIIQIDTREKPRAIQKILNTFNNNHIECISSKMYVGDYCYVENPLWIIDRKQNIAEIAANATTEHGRSRRELERLDKIGGYMVYLIEQNRYTDPNGKNRHVNSLEDIMFWENPRGVVDGVQVFKILDAWQHKHNIAYEFCDKRETGQRIIQILDNGLDVKEAMQNGSDEQKND